MKRNIKSFFLLDIFILLFTFSLFAQTETKLIDGKQFIKENSKWFVLDDKSEAKFLVDETSLSVKLKENFPRQDFDNMCKALNIEIVRENMLGIIDLKLPETSNIFGVYEKFEKSAMFEWIDINSFGKKLSSIDPNDPAYSNQYFLDDGSGYQNINMNEAWDYLNDNNIDISDIVVAVLDEGVRDDHGDLDGNMWSNTQGFHGYDYVQNDNYPEPTSSDHHGTSVAGLIAAETNNSNGAASVAGGWSTSGAKIMSVRVMNSGSIESDDIDDAILYAANNGAKIINMSFQVDELSAIKSALDYAYFEKGVLLIAAGGNAYPSAKGYLLFPARDYRVMGVGGITKTGGVYGDYGPGKEIVAPSTGIWTLINNTTPGGYNTGLFDLSGNGTSASAPQVAAAAALIWSTNSNFLHIDIRKNLILTAADRGAAGFDEYFGYGLLDVYTALAVLDDYLEKPEPPNLSVSIVSDKAKLSWTHGHLVDGFKIYRAISDHGRYRFTEIADVSGATTNWTDNHYDVFSYSPFAARTIYYRITAYYDDTPDYESVFSNEVKVSTNQLDKKNTFEDKVEFTYKLEQNYPNPFNPSTVINFELANESNVSIKVYDVLGREITELVNGKLSEGKHKINFNAGDLSNGVYFYTIEAGNFRASKKMLLLK